MTPFNNKNEKVRKIKRKKDTKTKCQKWYSLKDKSHNTKHSL